MSLGHAVVVPSLQEVGLCLDGIHAINRFGTTMDTSIWKKNTLASGRGVGTLGHNRDIRPQMGTICGLMSPIGTLHHKSDIKAQMTLGHQ